MWYKIIKINQRLKLITYQVPFGQKHNGANSVFSNRRDEIGERETTALFDETWEFSTFTLITSSTSDFVAPSMKNEKKNLYYK